MHPLFLESLATQRRDELLANAAGSHRARNSRRIRSARTGWSRARLWFGSRPLTHAVNKLKALTERGLLSMLGRG